MKEGKDDISAVRISEFDRETNVSWQYIGGSENLLR